MEVKGDSEGSKKGCFPTEYEFGPEMIETDTIYRAAGKSRATSRTSMGYSGILCVLPA